MIRSGSAVLIALALPLQSCASQDTPTAPSGLPSDAVAVAFDRVDAIGGSLIGGPQEAARSVVREQQGWLEFWGVLTAALLPAPEPPSVDFTQDMVIVAAMGSRPTGGYTISIEGVYTSGGELYVDVLERSPGLGCFSTQVITAPVTAVRLGAHAEPVHFVTRQESGPCT